jgi:hypothetical protein
MNEHNGWNPNVRFQVGAADSFSECAITIVASRSKGISAPSAPGADFPASFHTCSRAAARALRIARTAFGPAAAKVLTSRDTVGSDATGPKISGEDLSTAMSARQSPPSASVTARSVRTFPGSCSARGRRQASNASDRPLTKPETRSVSISIRPPA